MSNVTEEIPDDIDDHEDFDDAEQCGEMAGEPDVQDEVTPPLSRAEIESAFRRATTGMSGGKERWAERATRGMTDEELAAALNHEIGIFGGQCGPGMLGISYQGSGLKIWVDRRIGSYRGKPILAGAATVAMARAVYGIKDPSVRQMSLL
jgi:hypothetical protein